jgi:hypothetical protein
MTRRRYIQVNGELIEVPLNYAPPPKNADAVLWNDRAYQDANDPRFTSRTQHREYMKRHGLTTVDDFTGHFAAEAKRRAEFLTTGKDASRRDDIARALEKRHG